MIENSEYLAMLRRMIRAAGRRLGDNPDELGALIQCQRDLDAAIDNAVAVARESYGLSWGDLARLTGTSRQACQQRWGRKVADARR